MRILSFPFEIVARILYLTLTSDASLPLTSSWEEPKMELFRYLRCVSCSSRGRVDLNLLLPGKYRGQIQRASILVAEQYWSWTGIGLYYQVILDKKRVRASRRPAVNQPYSAALNSTIRNMFSFVQKLHLHLLENSHTNLVWKKTLYCHFL